jgi:hypothetical protein
MHFGLQRDAAVAVDLLLYICHQVFNIRRGGVTAVDNEIRVLFRDTGPTDAVPFETG